MAERMPLPHFITARGDSTRLVRKIHLLLNYRHVQNFDSITSLLKKFMLAPGRPGGRGGATCRSCGGGQCEPGGDGGISA
jgi:hypothetical protein